MGRYDGEDYDYDKIPVCAAGQHNFAMNGTCWKCQRTRDGLINQARELLRIYDGGGQSRPK